MSASDDKTWSHCRINRNHDQPGPGSPAKGNPFSNKPSDNGIRSGLQGPADAVGGPIMCKLPFEIMKVKQSGGGETSTGSVTAKGF